MKILSDMKIGGRLSKWLVGGHLLLMMSIQSCDYAYILPLENNKFSYDIALSERDTAKISCMYFLGTHTLFFDLKGDYIINPDSLKLHICDENVKILKPDIGSETEKQNKNDTCVRTRRIATKVNYEYIDQYKGSKDPLVLYILPSNFIMKDNKKVLTDSLRIVLRRPKKKWLW